MNWADPITLSGKHVTLALLERENCAALQETVKDGDMRNGQRLKLN
jgi:hypothetical protein